MKQKYDALVSNFLRESPVAPTKPVTKPDAPAKPVTPPSPNPRPPNPSPFRRHRPGEMPDVAPKGAAANLKKNIKNTIQKYTKFIKAN